MTTDPGSKPTLWWASCTLGDLPELDDWLGPREAERLAGLRFAKRRDDWRLGRWTAKLALRASGLASRQTPLPQIEILAAASGAPQVFLAGARAACSISLSHSSGVALCVAALQPMALGCDLERIEARDPALVSDYFTTDEAGAVAQAAVADRTLLVNLIWSAKESALKALSAGLRRDTRSVVVAADPAEGENRWSSLAVTCRETNRVFHGWWCAGAGFVRTIVADRLTGLPLELTPQS